MQHPLLNSSNEASDDETDLLYSATEPLSRRSSTSLSSLATTKPAPRIHTIKPGDTIEGIAITYNCSVSELKRLNRLFWQSDSIHLRKTLQIPAPLARKDNSSFAFLKHDLSSHPHNHRLFTRSTSLDLPSPSKEAPKRYSLDETHHFPHNQHLLDTLRTLDTDLSSILSSLIKPAPDTLPNNVAPIISLSRSTLRVSIYLTQLSYEAILQQHSARCKRGFTSPEFVATAFPPIQPQDSLLLPPSISLMPQNSTKERPQWRVIVQLSEPVSEALGECVRKVVEGDIVSRVLQRL
ncbi:hypothetical protein BCR33DRAFT_718627 [Rhizoclosmatium globosum]|uniref:LysM domain-containing protein n=1 Tax=Rhizoclosmatium globosum TaxID=329046 RepID=A0A1Y2C4Y3_9FUNG|nr:hypothetical protein BCR33DRAFT_718627 [Rhizoclosmatium globosum]|eukprot:ORY41996.1 hypothetical protein BCR33DRAFT_718627 [Rhizoclosmatium globosum]